MFPFSKHGTGLLAPLWAEREAANVSLIELYLEKTRFHTSTRTLHQTKQQP